MKVLKKGNVTVPWEAEIECPACEAVLLVDEEDVSVRVQYRGAYGDDPVETSVILEIVCPECGFIVKLNNTQNADLERSRAAAAARASVA